MFDKYKKEKYNINIVSDWFLHALALLFIYLKLVGHIAWSWWWVLAPLWIPALIVFIVALIIAFAAAVKK
jgi:hypothetical protein